MAEGHKLLLHRNFILYRSHPCDKFCPVPDRVACLENEDHIISMINALDKSVETFNKQNNEMIALEIDGIGDFRKEIIFAKVTKDDCLTNLIRLSDILEDCCKSYEVPPSDDKGFTPHLTLAKLSRMPFKIKKKVKKIEGSSYERYKNHRFGKQLITSLQLCSMLKPKDNTGYYHIQHTTQMLNYKMYSTLSEGDYCINDAAHIIVSTVLNRAFLHFNNITKVK